MYKRSNIQGTQRLVICLAVQSYLSRVQCRQIVAARDDDSADVLGIHTGCGCVIPTTHTLDHYSRERSW